MEKLWIYTKKKKKMKESLEEERDEIV